MNLFLFGDRFGQVLPETGNQLPRAKSQLGGYAVNRGVDVAYDFRLATESQPYGLFEERSGGSRRFGSCCDFLSSCLYLDRHSLSDSENPARCN
jgi:hypothetical protein